MKNFVQDGKLVTVSAPYQVSSGGGVKVGHMFGIAVVDANQNDNFDIAVLGVYDLVKDTSTFADGDLVYWDDTAKKATSTATGNTLIGVATLLNPDATSAPGGASGDATVRVRLNARFS